jgi:hypothetical protein
MLFISHFSFSGFGHAAGFVGMSRRWDKARLASKR